jgi:hypothetical protein
VRFRIYNYPAGIFDSPSLPAGGHLRPSLGKRKGETGVNFYCNYFFKKINFRNKMKQNMVIKDIVKVK